MSTFVMRRPDVTLALAAAAAVLGRRLIASSKDPALADLRRRYVGDARSTIPVSRAPTC